jgi:hypothetical protein
MVSDLKLCSGDRVGEEIGYKVEKPDKRCSSPFSTVKPCMETTDSRVHIGGSSMI